MLKVCMPKCSGRASLLVTSVVLYVSTAEPLFDWCLLGDSLMVELRTLTPPVVVRIHVPQPTPQLQLPAIIVPQEGTFR